MEFNRQKMQCPLRLPISAQRHSTDRGTNNQVPWVDLQSSLSWRNHISCVTKKANNMLVFLWPNLRQASEETKANAYFTMVRSNLDYCRTIWSPFQQGSKHQAEMVQPIAARFCNKKIQRCRRCHRPAQPPKMEDI